MNTNATDPLDQLIAETEERLGATEPAEWGEPIDLAEGEKFIGRFLREAISPITDRGVLLLLAPDAGKPATAASVPVFMRERALLRSELDRLRPGEGDLIVINRGADKEGRNGAYHVYAIACAPCPEPLPEPAAPVGKGADGGIPF